MKKKQTSKRDLKNFTVAQVFKRSKRWALKEQDMPRVERSMCEWFMDAAAISVDFGCDTRYFMNQVELDERAGGVKTYTVQLVLHTDLCNPFAELRISDRYGEEREEVDFDTALRLAVELNATKELSPATPCVKSKDVAKAKKTVDTFTQRYLSVANAKDIESVVESLAENWSDYKVETCVSVSFGHREIVMAFPKCFGVVDVDNPRESTGRVDCETAMGVLFDKLSSCQYELAKVDAGDVNKEGFRTENAIRILLKKIA